jgi:hypothetical protein
MIKIIQAIINIINRRYIFAFHVSEREVLEKLLTSYQNQIADKYDQKLSRKIDAIQSILDELQGVENESGN